jgi:histidine triad (HIT) family protein
VSFELPDNGSDCTFCSIVAGKAEANWETRPSGESAVACFHNRLNWVRVMLLVVPTQHMTQQEIWTSEVLGEAAEMAVDMGDAHCSEEGYRIISNFGLQAHQSQLHAHIHVISGTSRLLETGNEKSNLSVDNEFSVDEFEVDETPFAARISPTTAQSQREMWKSDQFNGAASTAFRTAETYSPNGFRFMSSFDAATEGTQPGENDAGLFLLGGGQLGLYASAY